MTKNYEHYQRCMHVFGASLKSIKPPLRAGYKPFKQIASQLEVFQVSECQNYNKLHRTCFLQRKLRATPLILHLEISLLIL